MSGLKLKVLVADDSNTILEFFADVVRSRVPWTTSNRRPTTCL